MNNYNETLSTTDIHNKFDGLVHNITQGAREFALDNENICADQLIAQIIMDTLGNPDVLDMATKQRLVVMAGHMGPDWAQALYHAAVFITKVA